MFKMHDGGADSSFSLLAAAVTADTKHFQPFDQQLFEVGMDVGCGKEN